MAQRYELPIGGRTLIIETGKLAQQANGAVTVTYTEQKADGSKGAAIVAGWDLKGAKAI